MVLTETTNQNYSPVKVFHLFTLSSARNRRKSELKYCSFFPFGLTYKSYRDFSHYNLERSTGSKILVRYCEELEVKADLCLP